jgi:hypothetical protein
VASSKTTRTLKSLLDRWEEPVSKNEVSGRKIASFIYRKNCPVHRILTLNQCQRPYRLRMAQFRISSAFASGFHIWYATFSLKRHVFLGEFASYIIATLSRTKPILFRHSSAQRALGMIVSNPLKRPIVN